MKRRIKPLLVGFLLPILACNKPQPPPETAAPPKPAATNAPAFTPARQTSFAEVTSQLDAGGDLFLYLSTDQWLAGMSTNVAQLRDVVLKLAEAETSEREQVSRVLDLVVSAIKGSGVETLTGVGVSGVQVTPELHRTKMIMHHRPGQGGGLLWNVMGSKPHLLTGMDLLTTNTAMAAFGDLDVAAVWGAMEKGLGQADLPEVSDAIKRWPVMFEQQTKMSWEKLLASFGGEIGMVLTLNNDQSVEFPMGEKTVSFPEPGLLIVMKVNDDLIYDRVSTELKKIPQVEVTEEKDLKMCSMPFPMPLPIELQPTVASAAGHLLVASSPALVRHALAVRDGKTPGLRQTGEFAALLKLLPAQGNQFVYVDRRLSAAIQDLQQQALNSEQMKAAQMQFAEKFFLNRKPVYGLSIGGHTETGWCAVAVGNHNMSAAVLAAPAVPAVAVASAMLLPALSNAKAKAQSIQCMNNMKQQGVALRMWAMDNNDQFPFNVGTGKGGTMELCDRNDDGFDRNSYRHFQVMSNELSTPKILVCPGEPKRQPATDFQLLRADNVSYQVRSGTTVNETNPNEVLIYCPVHHHVGRADGSVQQGAKNRPANF